MRFVAADCGGESHDEPLVTLDGQPQPGMTADKARKMAENLRVKGRAAGTGLENQTMKILPSPAECPRS